MRDLSSPTRDGTHAPAVKAQSLNHWMPGKSQAVFPFLHYLFIYFSWHWVFIAVLEFSLVVESKAISLLQCTGFSCGAQGLGAWASVVAAHGFSCSDTCGILASGIF